MEKSQVEKPQTFGDFFRVKRISLGLTLRIFCQRYGYDPAYISRIERNLLSSPEDRDKLEAFAKALELKEGTTERVTFFDLAYISKGKIPSDLTRRKEIVRHLPLLFRTIRGKRLSRKKMEELVKLLNET